MVNLQQLIEFDSSDHCNRTETIDLLSSLFNYAKSYKVINDTALIFGINCDITCPMDDVILFSGHFDTVGFTTCCKFKIQDDKVYGRGTSDMKSYFYCIDVFFRKNVLRIKKPMIVAITFDEEIDNKGVNSVIKYLNDKHINATYCILGEPTQNNCCISSDGCYDVNVVIYGESCHITQSKHATRAIDNCIIFINEILKTKETYNSSIYIKYLNCGTSFNYDSNVCNVGIEIRSIEHNYIESAIKRFKDLLAAKNIVAEFSVLDNYLKPFYNANSRLSKIVCSNNAVGVGHFSASSEAGFYQESGIDTIIFGPGDIKQAHKNNEYVEISKLEEYIDLLDCFVADV